MLADVFKLELSAALNHTFHEIGEMSGYMLVITNFIAVAFQY